VKIDGGCHCGQLRYEAEIDPLMVTVCHCTDCQTLSGSAFRTAVPVAKENFRLLSGQLKAYTKTAESGNRRLQTFCPECGTPIYSAAPGHTGVFYIRVGTSRQRSQLRPQLQIWSRSAQSWVKELAAVERLEKQD
jgi:hypothetical protein